MQATRQNLLTRDDTFFGVCQALGEDFRFPPNLLRLGFALAFFWNPIVVVGAYFAVGILVALTRFIAPDPRPAQVLRYQAAAPTEQAAPEPREEPAHGQIEELAAAA